MTSARPKYNASCGLCVPFVPFVQVDPRVERWRGDTDGADLFQGVVGPLVRYIHNFALGRKKWLIRFFGRGFIFGWICRRARLVILVQCNVDPCANRSSTVRVVHTHSFGLLIFSKIIKTNYTNYFFTAMLPHAPFNHTNDFPLNSSDCVSSATTTHTSTSFPRHLRDVTVLTFTNSVFDCRSSVCIQTSPFARRWERHLENPVCHSLYSLSRVLLWSTVPSRIRLRCYDFDFTFSNSSSAPISTFLALARRRRGTTVDALVWPVLPYWLQSAHPDHVSPFQRRVTCMLFYILTVVLPYFDP